MLLRTTTLRSLLSTTLKPRLLTTSTSATSTEPEPEPKPEPPHHPWPEWVTFVDRLKSRGYIYDTPSDHDPGFAYTDHQLLKDPCFSFARDRYDFLRSLPKADIRNIVDFGCPTLVRKVVLSAKRLREYAGLEEKNVCDVCSLRGTCDNAYVKPKDFDDPLTMDIMRLLLFYALDPMVVSRTKKPAGIEQVESSARRLLSMIIDSTEPSKRPASTELPKNSHKVLNSTAIVTGNAEWTQVVETRNAEWTCPKPSDKENLILSQLMLVALHMGGLGVPEAIAWPVIESLAKMNNIDYEHYVQLRWYLLYVQQLNMMYWGMSDSKVQTSPSFGMKPQHSQDVIHDSQQPASETAPARGWVRSMFGKEAAVKVNSFRYGNGLTAASETSGAGETGSPRRQNLANAGRNNIQSNVRILRGHSGAITALHSVSKKEVWDLVGDREDSGFFVSGSTDCSIKMWDPSHRGSELLATLKGHTGAVRAICSDRQKMVSGSDDLSILVWDKHKFIPLEELKGHKAPISHVRMLSGERVLSSSHDGTVKMWDARIGSCIATVARYPGAVLCMEYDDSTGILAAAGRNSMVHIWDIRAGKLVHELSGHTKWIRSIRMFGDRVITGSDDWTARVWSISQGRCEAVLTHHAGPVLCVEHSQPDDGIITGSGDGSVRFWENADGDIKCAKEMSFNSSVLSINAGGEWLAIGTADNSMSLFNQPRESICSEGWQLYRTPRASSAVVRCMASNIERKQICSGGRDGLLRMWDATINI